MVKGLRSRLWFIIFLVYGLSYVCRIFEYLVLRTDQTFWGEAFIHKVIGLAILFGIAKTCSFSLQDLGFSRRGFWKSFSQGLFLGILTFLLAYAVEVSLLISQGKFESLEIYVSSFAVDKNVGRETSLIFFLICIIGNIINILMEEGTFRGLFQKVLEGAYSFIWAGILSSFLFGLWHLMGPLRNYLDGEMTSGGFVLYSLMMVGTSFLIGFKFVLMTRLTGSLYMAMANHYFNDFIVNILHVQSQTGTDQLMFVRISIAQGISFMLVLFWYLMKKRDSR